MQYPNDPYKDEVHWPEGFGQLTNVNTFAYDAREFKKKANKLGDFVHFL